MKKVMFCLAVAGMFAFAACNGCNNKAEEAECNAPETEVVEETAVEGNAEEAVEEAAQDVEEAAQDVENAQ